ncbi:hypothetical protein PGTUg99_033070 [Puccinia graminis f. sp. tritici]|uniref:Uncharacterized protein n=1 Tax=Puccinia graminis f. sp. tritici TaxID=56615 RepID=A0A5B0RIX9_PUCGR|nr:hypothetical protein PGTUg99_033070 [Puccinia graminis f. sp. tritici]
MTSATLIYLGLSYPAALFELPPPRLQATLPPSFELHPAQPFASRYPLPSIRLATLPPRTTAAVPAASLELPPSIVSYPAQATLPPSFELHPAQPFASRYPLPLIRLATLPPRTTAAVPAASLELPPPRL